MRYIPRCGACCSCSVLGARRGAGQHPLGNAVSDTLHHRGARLPYGRRTVGPSGVGWIELVGHKAGCPLLDPIQQRPSMFWKAGYVRNARRDRNRWSGR